MRKFLLATVAMLMVSAANAHDFNEIKPNAAELAEAKRLFPDWNSGGSSGEFSFRVNDDAIWACVHYGGNSHFCVRTTLAQVKKVDARAADFCKSQPGSTVPHVITGEAVDLDYECIGRRMHRKPYAEIFDDNGYMYSEWQNLSRNPKFDPQDSEHFERPDPTPTPAPVTPALVAPAPVTPAPAPVAPTPVTPVLDAIPLYQGVGSTPEIDVMIGSQPVRMLLDTGATSLLISPSMAEALLRDGEATWGEDVQLTLADGSVHNARSITIKHVRVGKHVLDDVRASISSGADQMLFGFTVLARIGKFTIDPLNRQLIFG
jgi:clan AA aspartic protease (TIGR02281 family)